MENGSIGAKMRRLKQWKGIFQDRKSDTEKNIAQNRNSSLRDPTLQSLTSHFLSPTDS